ncbi:MAG TPA: single-stranded-DNA-specific exonuclease RecJ [Desulfobacterales bacterium]
MKKRWQYRKPDPERVDHFRKTFSFTAVTATLLANRNLDTIEAAQEFLQPSLHQLRSPLDLCDLPRAIERIVAAVDRGQNILIFGDYDVDGITATAVLEHFLQSIGARVSSYIPHRLQEGYGFQEQHVEAVAAARGARLVDTVDNGSSSNAAIRKAVSAGIDVVVTDHHDIESPPPDAVAVVNPKRADCSADFEHLAGVGVAMALVIGLRKALRERGFWQRHHQPNLKNYCDLVALGTVADAVPLIRENRVYVKTGLDILRHGQSRPGLSALLQRCAIAPSTTGAGDLAFKLAPRLNAAGRMQHADLALQLLTAAEVSGALRLADTLDQLNRQRRQIETDMMNAVRKFLRENPDVLNNQSLVFDRADWHEGVLGIVASRLVERYGKPVVMIATGSGEGKGSARSVAGIDLHGGLSQCSQLLEAFGGHAMAAGLRIRPDRIESFRKAFEICIRQLSGGKKFEPEIQIDYRLDFEQINETLLNEIDMLEPFGSANPQPLFAAHNVNVLENKIIGEHHRRMILQQSGGRHAPRMQAVQFNVDPGRSLPATLERVAYHLQWNHWNGRRTPQLIIVDQG